MDIALPFDFRYAPEQLLQRCGYAGYTDINTGQTSFSRTLATRGNYPRFHVYVEVQENLPVLRLHIDQKKPVYAGAHAHNAEYDGEVVAREAERIKSVLTNLHQA
jgi:hypothetical protein